MLYVQKCTFSPIKVFFRLHDKGKLFFEKTISGYWYRRISILYDLHTDWCFIKRAEIYEK